MVFAHRLCPLVLVLFLILFTFLYESAPLQCVQDGDCRVQSDACINHCHNAQCLGSYIYMGCVIGTEIPQGYEAADILSCAVNCTEESALYFTFNSSNICSCVPYFDNTVKDLNRSEVACASISDATAVYWLVSPSSCPVAGYRCDETNKCVHCPSNLQKYCVECNTNYDCRNDSACDAICLSDNTCSLANHNCSSNGMSCNATTGTCLCSIDRNCAVNDDCNSTCGPNGICLPGGLDCAASGQVCNASSQTCYDYCDNDSQCPNGYVCYNNKCVECTASFQCLRKYRNQQPFYQYCVNNTCGECLNSPSCQNDGNCDGTCGIDNTTGRTKCIEGLLNCTADNQYCITVPEPTCVDCRNDFDCKNNETTPFCRAQVCVECRGEFDCNKGYFCDGKCMADGFCDPGPVVCNSTYPHCIGRTQCVQCTSRLDCINDNRTNLPNCVNSLCVECATQDDDVCAKDDSCDGKCNLLYNKCEQGKLNCTAMGTHFHCDKPTRACVECYENSDCTWDSTLKFCAPNKTCVPCLQDIDCRGTSACDATCSNNLCIPGVLNCTALGSHFRCLVGNTTCVECSSNSDCNFDNTLKFCAPNLTCVPCLQDIDCRGNDACDATCTEYKCHAGNLNCTSLGPHFKCEKTTSTCSECSSDNDCNFDAALKFCFQGTCVPCIQDESCRDDGACDATCQNNKCVIGTLNCSNTPDKFCEPSSGTCVQCNKPADCPVIASIFDDFTPTKSFGTGFNCTNHKCYCLGDGSCRNEKNCNSTCVDGVCLSGVDCTAAGLLCNVTSGNCFNCVSDSNCTSDRKWCVGGLCTQCRTEVDCVDRNDACEKACTQGVCTYFGANCTAFGSRCNNVTRKCDECVDTTQCNSTMPFCDGSRGVCVQCLNDTQCASESACGAVCVTTIGVCTQGTNCTEMSKFCSQNTCVECEQDTQCNNVLKGCDNGQCAISFRSAWRVFIPTGVGILIIIIVLVVIAIRCVKTEQETSGLYQLIKNNNEDESSMS